MWLAAIGYLLVLFVPQAPSHPPTGPYASSIVVIGLLLAFAVAGSRIAWTIAVLLMGAGVVGTVLNGTSWEVAARLLVLIMLLLPVSRAYVWKRRPAERG
jgi:lysylphosphatidylglycerol synthetase-like protein (DUF2156 family)